MELLHEADNDKEIDREREREVIAAGAGVDVRCEVVLVSKDDATVATKCASWRCICRAHPQPSQYSQSAIVSTEPQNVE